jgi:uncharacterized protein YecT (DUF1311 family)
VNARATLALVVVVAAASAYGGYTVGDSPAKDARPAPSATPTPSPSPTPSPTPSDTPSPEPTATGCFASADTQLQLNDCAAADARDAERKLAAVLADARRVTTGQARTAFDKAQREWETYRDTFCDSYLIDGGSIGPMNAQGCRAGLALARARDVCNLLSPNGPDAPPSCKAVEQT